MKYTIIDKFEPSKNVLSQDELDELLDKAISLLLDGLIINGHIKIGE